MGLRKEIDRLTWPEAYVPTVEALTPKLGDPEEWLMTERDGTDIANFWNLCAWLDEGVDRIEAGATPAQLAEVADRIDAWPEDQPDTLDVKGLAAEVRMADPTGSNQFIEANNCRPFPS